MSQTKGQYRVELGFNPSKSTPVDEIKAKTAELIDLIERIPATKRGTEASEARAAEIERIKALAQTSIENGAMWAVKAATKPLPD